MSSTITSSSRGASGMERNATGSRRGRKAVTIYLDTAAHRQLRMLALEQDSSVQHLAVEAFNDLFQKLGKPRIAD